MWPEVATEQQLDALKENTDALLAGVAAIAHRHGWSRTPVEHVQDGSLPVFALEGDVILKLYPGTYHRDFSNETRVLEHIAGRVACPEVLATGDLDGWCYLAMTRLQGQQLATVWDDISRSEQLQLAEEIGLWLRDLHAIDTSDLELPLEPWSKFVAGQFPDATGEQRRLGLGEPWLSQIEPFLAKVEVVRDGPTVLLHTEVMREHAFVARRNGRWRLSGLLDFEPAMLGAREYDFASVGVFLSCGDADALRHLLLAYGYREAELDVALQRRFLAYTLLHRYRHMGWHLRRLPPPDGVVTLEQLATVWWKLTDGAPTGS